MQLFSRFDRMLDMRRFLFILHLTLFCLNGLFSEGPENGIYRVPVFSGSITINGCEHPAAAATAGPHDDLDGRFCVNVFFKDTPLVLHLLMEYVPEMDRFRLRDYHDTPHYSLALYDDTRSFRFASWSPEKRDGYLKTEQSNGILHSLVFSARPETVIPVKGSEYRIDSVTVSLKLEYIAREAADIGTSLSPEDVISAEVPVPCSYTGLTNWLLEPGIDPLIKLRGIHDWICLNIRYDWEKNPPAAPAEVVGRGKAVCQGYSLLFRYLAGLAGIPVRYKTGYIIRNGSPVLHAWNLVRIGETLYVIDVTWDAERTERNGGSYAAKYFLVPEEEMMRIYQE